MKISVKVKPTAKEEKVEKIDANSFKVSVKEPPKEGRANRAVHRALAAYLRIPKSALSMVKGSRSRHKIFMIHDKLV